MLSSFFLAIFLATVQQFLNGATTKLTVNFPITGNSIKQLLEDHDVQFNEIETSYHLVEEVRPMALRSFKETQKALSHVDHTGVFAIKQRNFDELKLQLEKVSDPNSGFYGEYMTKDEINEWTIDPVSAHHIQRYLELHQFTVIDTINNGEYITASAPIHIWEKVLNTEFFEFSLNAEEWNLQEDDPALKLRFLRAKQYSLPDELHEHVSYVFNIISFPQPQDLIESTKRQSKLLKKHINIEGKIYSSYVTPALLAKVYDIRNTTGSSLASQAVYETIGQTFSPKDLTLFQKFFELRIHPMSQVIGGHSSDSTCLRDINDCVEANLDIQYLMAMSQNSPTTYYYWSGQDFLLQWITKVAAMKNPPLVFSISYGADEQQLSQDYADGFNSQAIKLGLMGVTIVASSGDDGAVSSSGRMNPLRCGYSPSFPASSPYVVAVGGTMVRNWFCYIIIIYIILSS
jgi:subtilase family serine protease